MRAAAATPAVDYRELLVLSLIPILLAVLILTSWGLERWAGLHLAGAALALAATLLGGYQRVMAAIRDVISRRITVNVFVAIALAATVAIGELRAAAIVVFIMAVAGALESYTIDRTRTSIRGLLDLAPKTATVRRDGREVPIPLDQVALGDIVVVRPGERIPVDGVVAGGASAVNQAPITGESMPVEKFAGHEVFGGSLNETGMLQVRTTRVGADTKLAQIIHLVEQAQSSRAPIQNIADRFTTWFLPAVLLFTAVVFFIWQDVRIAISILLVTCPCAFAIATPTAVTAGVSRMARRAVLVKGGIFLELAGTLTALVVDKTGTFTLGRPVVVDAVGLNGHQPREVLRLAAVAERYSEHPLARAVMARAAQEGLAAEEPEEFKAEVGKGVVATHQGHQLLVGKPELFDSNGVTLDAEAGQLLSRQASAGHTPILVGLDGRLAGIIAIADEVRPEAPRAIAALKALGLGKVVMLTGDNRAAAAGIARQIGVDEFHAELLPEHKSEFVRRLQAEGHRVAMVGDGINDAPALALADVGIAMGSAGTDVAIETADVTLMNDDLGRVVELVGMSRKIITRIKLNIFFSMAYNAIGLSLGALGLLTPVLAVIFQEAGCISVVLSSTLLLWERYDGKLS